MTTLMPPEKTKRTESRSPSTKAPGIQFVNIYLMRSAFVIRDPSADMDYQLELVGKERAISEDGSTLLCYFDFDLMYGIEDPACEFTCSFSAQYRRLDSASMTWEEFTDGMALAHVIAYLREFVMNVTTRSPLQRIFLRPVNAHAFVLRYDRRQGQDTTNAQDGDSPLPEE